MTSYRVEILEPSSLLSVVDDPARAFERVWRRIPQSRPRRLWGFLEDDGGLFVKGLRSLRGRGPRGFCEGLRTHRELRHLQRMAERGLPVPRVLAYGQERRAGFPTRSFLVQRLLVGAQDLDRWLAAHPAGTPGRPRLLERLGALVARMHAVGVFHRDLSCRNILVCDEHRLHLIDCPRARIDPPALRRPSLRRADLFRLVKGLLRDGVEEHELEPFLAAARVSPGERRVTQLARAQLEQGDRRRSAALVRWIVRGR